MSNNFGTILSELLEERGVSQRWLADAANTKEATISRYINGVNKSARLDILIEIANALNVSTDFLLGRTTVQNFKIDTTPEERILISAFNKATERDTAVIWQLLDDYITPSDRTVLARLNKEKTDINVG